MKISELEYDFPEELIATCPQEPCRIMQVTQNKTQKEISKEELLAQFQAGDILVLNDTQVLKRRVFAQNKKDSSKPELEILFLSTEDQRHWTVLFPSKKFNINDEIELPLGRKMKLLKKGRPQFVETDQILNESYFQEVGELPLPPYIQKARSERHAQKVDSTWYQTSWAEKPGSLAAPTASLHFTNEDLSFLQKKNVKILFVTLHVGLGTFLPVIAEDLNQHEMHEEWVSIPNSTWQEILTAKKEHRHIWALGTTVTRALESAAMDMIPRNKNHDFEGGTRLLIQPGFHFQVVDRLLTNFHQPQSTLLALVAAFAGLENVKNSYKWAIDKKFRLFSYGDLSVWDKSN